MIKNYINSLKEILAERDSMTPEKLQAFAGQTVRYLSELRLKLTSQDVKEREEAMNLTLELKDLLEMQMGALNQSMGIDCSRISENDLLEQVDASEQEACASLNEQFQEIKQSIKHKK